MPDEEEEERSSRIRKLVEDIAEATRLGRTEEAIMLNGQLMALTTFKERRK